MLRKAQLTLGRTTEHEQLDATAWFYDYSQEVFDPEAVMDTVAGNGNLEILQWLQGNRIGGCTRAAMDIAATSGHLSIVKWLHDNSFEDVHSAQWMELLQMDI